MWSKFLSSGNKYFVGTQLFLRPTIFLTQSFWDPKFVWTQNCLYSNKMLDQQFHPYQIFGTKLCLDQTVCTINNFGQQFNPDQIFGTKLFSDPSFLRSNIWFDRTNFCTRLGYFDLKCCLENKIKTWVWLSSAQLVYSVLLTGILGL